MTAQQQIKGKIKTSVFFWGGVCVSVFVKTVNPFLITSIR